MLNISGRIAISPEPDLPAEGASSPTYSRSNRKPFISALFEGRKDKTIVNNEGTNTRTIATEGEAKSCDASEVKTAQSNPDESEVDEELTEDQKLIKSKVNDLRNLRDCVALRIIERVAKFANNGRNTAKGPIEAWQNANTQALQEKARSRCAGKCRELWEKMEKQKSQVMAIRLENTHFMNNLAREDREKALQSSIIEEEEEETMDLCTHSESDITVKACNDTDEVEESKSPALYVDRVDGDESNIISEDERKASSASADETEVARRDSMEHMTEVKFPNSSPSTIDTESLSSNGENDSLGSADVLSDTEINALSMSDDICAIQRSTIDFALAIIDCDVVLVDIDIMQSLILAAECAINGLVFKAVERPVMRRANSAKVFQAHIATVSKRASKKMNAIQRAIAKVDKHRQKQRMISSR
jgi:hypothetical protein